MISETTIIAITASVLATIAPTIAAIAAYRQSKRNASAVQTNDTKTDRLIENVEVVRGLANGNLEKLQKDFTVLQNNLTQANMQIANLQALVYMLVDNPRMSTKETERVIKLRQNEQASEDSKE